MTLVYEFATGDLLEDRNTYFYTAYQGSSFLAAWRRARDAALRDLPPAAQRPPVGDVKMTGEAGGKTADLLEADFADFERTGVCRNLDRLIQRFEVSKRLHRAYGADWRALDRDDYHDLGLYLRFAELAEASYARTGRLPCLNALIKCLDTMVALRDRLTRDQAARLATLIARERLHVGRLEADMQK